MLEPPYPCVNIGFPAGMRVCKPTDPQARVRGQAAGDLAGFDPLAYPLGFSTGGAAPCSPCDMWLT